MAEPAPPRFVAVANATYASLPALTRAVPDSQELADVLRSVHGFEPAVVPDLDRGAVLIAMDQKLHKDTLPGGSLILSWVGHAAKGDRNVLSLMARSEGEDVEVVEAGKLGQFAARTGARQMLVLIDTCFSGGGVVDAVAAATAVDQGRASPGMASFVVVAASLADQPSRSGILIRELLRILREGPRKPDFRWNRSRKFITGHDLAQALLEDWSEPRHTPYSVSAGRVFDLVRNPLYQEGVPDQPVEHLLFAARGGAGDESFFTGRERALTEIVSWMGLGAPGLFVVTGPPGCGKSAVAGRIVSLSSAGERARLLKSGPIPAPLDPGAGSVDVQIHARGVTVETAAEALAQQLRIDPSAGPFGVLAEARRRRQAGDPLVFVIDGLDEARNFSRDVAVELLAPLAREALVLVATRDMPFGDTTLIRLLGPAAGVVDLGQDEAETRKDVRGYVVKRLSGVAPEMDPETVALELSGGAGGTTEAPFLLARLVTSQLRDHPVNTSSDGWRLSLATTVESALELDLQSVVLEVEGKPHPAAAREMIRALSLARGAGFPADDVWPAVATAVSASGTRYTRDHAYAVLTSLGRHIIAGSEGEQPVYRIAHQRLVDYMASDLSPGGRAAREDSAMAVAAAISKTYQELLDLGIQPRDHSYLWRYAWVHLAEAGTGGLELLRGLAARDRAAFLPDLASGLEFAASRSWSVGSAAEALPLAEEALQHRREAGDAPKLVMSLFQLALLRASVGDDQGADQAAEEASSLARKTADLPGSRAILGAALFARAMTQLREGRHKAARLLAEEAIALAEPAKFGKDASLWLSYAYAHSAAGQAALLMEDLDAAAGFCRKSVEILDQNVDTAAGSGRDTLLETLGSLAAVEFVRSFSARPDDSGNFVAGDASAAERVLRLYRAMGPQKSLTDVAISRGLQFLARSRMVDRARGLPVPDFDAVAGILSDSIELVRPFSEQMADAAIILASGLSQRSVLRLESDPAGASEDRAAAQRSLRRFAGQSTLAAVELGEMLAAEGASVYPAAIAGEIEDVKGLVSRELEAASLLRRSTAWLHRYVLASLLSRLPNLLPMAGGSEEQELAFRAEAIDVWRGLLGRVPEAPIELVGLLSDQAGRLLDRRTAEAADFAREALEGARQLPLPQFAALLGTAELNLAAVQLRLGAASGTRDLLESAIGHLEPAAGIPVFAGNLAAACTNLAHIEIEAGRGEEALAAARKAVALCETPGLPAILAGNRLQASLALGRALRASGRNEEGTATLRSVFEQLRSSLVAGRIDFSVYAAALNTAAPDLWDEALSALAGSPDLCRILAMIRRRPRDETSVTARAILEGIATARPGELRTIRAIARQQRSADRETFDAAWRNEAGEIPAWLRLEPAHEEIVIAWWNAPSVELARKYLESHPALLSQDTDIVLEELRFDGQDPDVVNRRLELLAAARERGIAAAYAPLLAEVAAREWMGSDDPEEHLAQHPELSGPDVAGWFREHAAQGEDAPAAFSSILQLAQRGESALAFQAANDPASFVSHLQPAWRSKDVARLLALATIVRTTAQDPSVRRAGLIASAIALALENNDAGAAPLIASALEDCGDAEREQLTSMAADAIAHHPAQAAGLARLIPMLHDGKPPA